MRVSACMSKSDITRTSFFKMWTLSFSISLVSLPISLMPTLSTGFSDFVRSRAVSWMKVTQAFVSRTEPDLVTPVFAQSNVVRATEAYPQWHLKLTFRIALSSQLNTGLEEAPFISWRDKYSALYFIVKHFKILFEGWEHWNSARIQNNC
jgi:hypothetical protein